MDILIFLIIALIPLGVVIRIPIIGSAFMYMIDIPIICLFFLVLLKSFQSKSFFSFFYNKDLKPLILFISFAGISLILNSMWLSPESFFISSSYLIRLILYINVGITITRKKTFPKKLLSLLGIVGFVTIVLGFIQYFYYQNLRNLFYLQWDDHLYRLFSTFLDPNFSGSLFVLEIILLLYYIIILKKKWLKILIFVMLFISIVGLFLTYSRSSLSMFFVSTILFFVLSKKIRVLISFGILCIIALLIIPKDLRIENMNIFRHASIFGRTDSYKDALVIFEKSPLYGIGFNSYRFAQKKYGLLDAKWEVTHAGAGVSNSYLFVLVTTGTIGFLLFINVWWSIVKYLWLQKSQELQKMNKDKENNFYFLSMVISSLIGIAVHGLFENTIFYPFILLWIVIILGIAYQNNKKIPKKTKTYG